MKKNLLHPHAIVLLAAAFLLALPARAQFGGGFGGGFGGMSRSGSSYNTEQRQYRSNTMLGDAMIQTDLETRSLIIITDEETNEHIKEIINSIDQPKPQVLLEVMFLEVSDRNDLDFGIEGSYRYVHDGINEGSLGTAFNVASGITQGGFYRVVADDWEATLKAMQEKGKTKVLSRPSILARNNQEAVIMVGQEIPMVTNTRTTDQGNTINTIQYSEIGIILRVTPYITKDGQVEMIVHPEISNLTDETVPISETLSSPVIAKREIETVVVTRDRQTVVLGGLIDNEKTDVVRKVPILGDIPLLGQAFRRTIKGESRKELLIFLKPTILATPEMLVAETRNRVRSSILLPQAVPEEDLERFIEGVPGNPADANTEPQLDTNP
ncbi:MAG: type II secretion system protein GspD [Verrucomicrobiales bacterium]|nr:type II secretion system protein GspD [Verrucomicrobiales bacterium]